MNKNKEYVQLVSVKSCATANKLIMYRAKKDVKVAEGSLQVCAGQEAGSAAAIMQCMTFMNKMKPKPSF